MKNFNYDIQEIPIRDEIFSPERINLYAQFLAKNLETSKEIRGQKLLKRVESNYKVFLEIYQRLLRDLENKVEVPSAGMWIVDNHFIIEDQIREIKKDLPQKYYDELPKIKDGELEGYPRIYSLALTLIAHLDSHLEISTITNFAKSFQTIAPLSSGEIWAMPITLRMVLLENLRRIIIHLIYNHEIKTKTTELTNSFLAQKVRPQEFKELITNLMNDSELSQTICTCQLYKELREQSPETHELQEIIQKHLAAKNINIEEAIQYDHLQQAITQVTLGNIVTSMRLLSNVDWQDFFENVSLLEEVLAKDPAQIYKRMDFASRDRYRHCVERISKSTKQEEISVANKAIELAVQAEGWKEKEKKHVGFYLIDQGREQLEDAFQCPCSLREKSHRFIYRRPNFTYFSLMAIFQLLLLLFAYNFYKGEKHMWLLMALAFFPVWESTINLLNLALTEMLPPRTLPRLELGTSVPENAKTFVVVPTIFKNKEDIKKQFEMLEIHFLSNNEDNISFAVLSDFADAETESTDKDNKLIHLADQMVTELNKKHSPDSAKFFYFHRPRKWNASEARWMGWERKRGKLEEFNRFLREEHFRPFLITAHSSQWDRKKFLEIKYVITLDADTQIPREAAKKLIGTIMHPLNSPEIDLTKNKLRKGYAVLQPRISIKPTSATVSLFSRIFASHSGLDPYTTAVSDVYQDLHGEGSFVGKGLYVVDEFRFCTENRIEENTVLSHDLFEGIMARTALATNIELLDDFPFHYEAYSKRLHRWIRGDWQIARWVLPFHGNDFNMISRWKIFDNLRRSLLAPLLLAWICFSLFFSTSPARAIALVFVLLLFPVLLQTLKFFTHYLKETRLSDNIRTAVYEFYLRTNQYLFLLMFLPHQAYLSLDAIFRTIYRLIISRKNLLEWTTAAETEKMVVLKKSTSLSVVLAPEAFVLFCSSSLYFQNARSNIAFAVPFFFVWSLIPFAADYISRKRPGKVIDLKEEDITFLRSVARRTWHYFECFISENDHWLAPDNFQEDPKPAVAHRTSPTNIGAMLLSTVSAYEFGHITSSELLERLERTQNTLDKLEKYKGHLYNWYETTTLKPLYPIYISTVDSGNLAAILLSLKSVCLEVPTHPIAPKQFLKGIEDTLLIVKETSAHVGEHFFTSPFFAKQRSHNEFRSLLQKLLEEIKMSDPKTMKDWRALAVSVRTKTGELNDFLKALVLEHGEINFGELPEWTRSSFESSKKFEGHLNTLMPLNEMTLVIFKDELRTEHKDQQKTFEEIDTLAESITCLSKIPIIVPEIRKRLLELEPLSNKSDSYMKLQLGLTEAENSANDYLNRFSEMSERYHRMAMSFDFSFLYNQERKIFSIGYNLSDGRMDNSYYDLLASEARIASFFAIAKGDVPLTHWFHLGRQMGLVQGNRALISWTASMFEYLMPLLIMKNYTDTLLDQTYTSVVKAQIAYTQNIGIPWGVSESAYNARDLLQFYQYGPFGIPGLGLKFGLGTDMVISPYSTVLAAMVAPHEALANLKRLKQEKAYGKYGFYESIDYTRSRLPKNQKNYIVKNYMAHHQGMIFISLCNVLHQNKIQKFFHADPMVKATELLLQEKIPVQTIIVPHREKETPVKSSMLGPESKDTREFKNIRTFYPQTNILSNGQYTTVTTTTGGGFSRYHDFAINRWSEDATLDPFGNFIYFHDHHKDKITSSAYLPVKNNDYNYECIFSEHKTEFITQGDELVFHTEIIVSPEDNVELRRVTIINNKDAERDIDCTSYLEPVFTRSRDDFAHLSFSKLFLETEFVASKDALIVKRRKRFHEDKEKWGLHVVITNGTEYAPTEFETDRLKFIGRGRTTADPLAITENQKLSNTSGTALDPVLSLRKFLRIGPRSSVKICYTTGYADSKENVLRLIDQYHDIHCFEREESLSWTQNQVKLRHLSITPADAGLYQELASAIIYTNPLYRPGPETLIKNHRTQEGLWALGISGDLPILVIKARSDRDTTFIRTILKAHEYLRLKNIVCDLVVLNEEGASYRMTVHDEIIRQVNLLGAADWINKNGGIFVLNASAISDEDKAMIHSFAKIVLDSNKGPLNDQLQRIKSKLFFADKEKNILKISGTKRAYPTKPVLRPDLNFFNGLGGFNQEGNEYVIYLAEGQNTPAPWINVMANQNNFGCIVSERGSGYTWANNSRENRLTPWCNDPVSDASGEAVYIRDEDTFKVWSPTPWPVRKSESYLIHHGLGYTRFLHNDHGIDHDYLVFVSLDENIKIGRLKIKNSGTYQRKLSCTFFIDWVLGINRAQSSQHLVTEKSTDHNVITARNPFSIEFNKETAFMAMSGDNLTFTCDRKEFLGRNHSVERPQGMQSKRLLETKGAGHDPCGVMRTFFNLEAGEEKEIIFVLGESSDQEKIYSRIQDQLSPAYIETAFNKVKAYWNSINQAIQVKTPAPEFDVLMNHWALYQTLSCRIWARTALYQSGGAFGFRDQLQDTLALLYSRPDIARAQILRCAAQQFEEGDVQHWWHPPKNRGVRTKFSDDLLWMPYVVTKYIERTDDRSLLDEQVTFIKGPLLKEGQEDLYIVPEISHMRASLYEHCLRAINHSLQTGAHDLPLMGAGDWNDGMNNVGINGKGESVWVGWFLSKILTDFSELCLKRGDDQLAQKYKAHAEFLVGAIEKNAWDGNWYMRAFFDDGTPLGSSQNDECRIDSLTQSWSVLTGKGNKERQIQSMNSVLEYLVRKKDRLCVLFTPPFDKGTLKPGYIKGYPPGIRENGGQYSHAAAWSAMAFALLEKNDLAYEVLSYLNPVTRTNSFSGLQLYKVEPYAIAADIYDGTIHTGRGGWSWYTGSSSLFYQAGLEYILGLRLKENTLALRPCVPSHWKEFSIDFQWKNTTYQIAVKLDGKKENSRMIIELDGARSASESIALVDDGKRHHLKVHYEA